MLQGQNHRVENAQHQPVLAQHVHRAPAGPPRHPLPHTVYIMSSTESVRGGRQNQS